MPELPSPKIRPVLFEPAPRKRRSSSGYAELQVTSNFSFLRGASHPEELVHTAEVLGYRAIAITDRDSLAGVVRAHLAAKECAVQFIVGCRLTLTWKEETTSPPFSILVYPTDREAYGGLCRLLTVGKRRSHEGTVILHPEDLFSECTGLVGVIVPPVFDPHGALESTALFSKTLHALKECFSHLSLAVTFTYGARNRKQIARVLEMARAFEIAPVVTNDVHYHAPERRPLQDVLTCIRERCTVPEAGYRLLANRERHLKATHEMHRLFSDIPQACRRTLEIAEAAKGFSLDQLKYEYPEEITPEGLSAAEHLATLVGSGAAWRYPGGIPYKVQKLIADELVLIRELDYEKYFLTCYDIVRFAEQRGILYQGRGAAANSTICYCLGITSVNPDKIDLLFARFVSKERNEPPDIDIDFEHERREEVIQYIYRRFGRHRAGLTCEVVTYRHRSAVRDVGKAIGLSLEEVDSLAKSIHRWTGSTITKKELEELGFDPSRKEIRDTLQLSAEILGFPRHLSQHVGGFIISQRALSETVPILNASMDERTIIEWDKDDIETLGMLKIDVLGLGMLTCIRKAFDFLNQAPHRDPTIPPLNLARVPSEDPVVYDMICKADTVGVFQIESRAQMSMLPRLKPRCFYDLVIEVAIVRPGPIQGNMVHPFLKRRSGLEKDSYPDERVRQILGKTLGVPIFQEQAMRLAIVLACFSPGEAEQLRRAMSAWKRHPHVIATFKQKIVAGMLANGYTEEFAETCMNQIKGFSEYGFPESHAASFALLVYASSWIKCHHPAVFAAALLNSQPMGFYAPAQIVQDVIQHGVRVLPVDITISQWDCTLEYSAEAPGIPALRLGMRLIRGLSEPEAIAVANAMQERPFPNSIHELWFKARAALPTLHRRALKLLAQGDAITTLATNRREALWEVQALPIHPSPLDPLLGYHKNPQLSLPLSTPHEELFRDYEILGLSLKGHPLGIIRKTLDQRRVSLAKSLRTEGKPGIRVSIAGIAIVRQRPGTAKGVVFISLEDETGIANLIIRPHIFDRFQRFILSSSCLLAHGTLERIGEVVYITVDSVESLDSLVLAHAKQPLPTKSYSY